VKIHPFNFKIWKNNFQAIFILKVTKPLSGDKHGKVTERRTGRKGKQAIPPAQKIAIWCAGVGNLAGIRLAKADSE